MKFSKTTFIILLLLLAAIVFEFNYLQGKLGKSDEKQNILPPLPIESNQTTLKKEEIQKKNYTPKYNKTKEIKETKPRTDGEILDTVTSYHQGYQEGCPKEPKATTENNTTKDSRAYQLGFENAKKDCVTQYKEKKSTTPTQNKSKDPNYQRGYQHGCNTSQGLGERDEKSYLGSKAYRAGWTEGRNGCKQAEKTTEKSRKRSKESQNFDQGYFDGCDTATQYYKRDQHQYERSASYRRGWNRGEYECSTQPPPMGF